MRDGVKRGAWAVLLSAALLLAAGCGGSGTTTSSDGGGGDSGGGGGGDAGAVTGLAVADKVSVVDAKQASTANSRALFAALRKFSALASVPADSDYARDKTFVYVSDRAGEAFDTVNMILCMISQTKYVEMVNQGPYTALVNSTACQGNDSADRAGASSQGGTSGDDAPRYDTWTVKSERVDADSAQIVSAWIHMKEGGGPGNMGMMIYARTIITEAASATNPYGLFTINYIGHDPANASRVMMKGFLKTEKNDSGKVIIKYAEREYGPDGATVVHSANAAFEKNDTAGQGSARIMEAFSGTPRTTGIDFAYSDTEFKRVIDNSSLCLDRTRFETSAWRYGLYDATTGSRQSVNAGFPVNTRQDGTGSYGYMGYYGLFLPNGVTVNDGNMIYKKVWNGAGESTTPYTIFVRGGKLKKQVRHEVTLADIRNIPLEGFDMQSQMMVRVIWDGSQLLKVATALQSQDGPPAWTEASEPVDTSSLPWGELNYYSQALGGQVRIMLDGCTQQSGGSGPPSVSCAAPGSATRVAYYVESVVYPGDPVPSQLACFDNCPQASSGDVVGSMMGGQISIYTFETDDAQQGYWTLKDQGGVSLVKTVGGSQSWGFNSGPLFEAALIADPNTSPLACDWTNPMTQQKEICGWKAWSVLDTFYTWETGTNNWNQFTAVKDSQGNFFKFDPPWQVAYIHSQPDSSAPDYKYDGTRFFLEYSGFGDLHGIPGKCFDSASGQTVTDCSGMNVRWVPEFIIPTDSTVTVGSLQYLVKPLEVEQRMKVKPGGCASLNPTSYALPSMDEWSDPALAAEPVVTGPPKVIGGVVVAQSL